MTVDQKERAASRHGSRRPRRTAEAGDWIIKDSAGDLKNVADELAAPPEPGDTTH